MTASRTSYLATSGLIALMAGLFVAVYTLNIRHYRASISSAEIAVEKSLNQREVLLLEQMEREENLAYAMHGTERIFDVDLFILQEGVFMPEYLADFPSHSVSKEDANAAFNNGVELLPSEDALPYFEKAARALPDKEVDWYQKISALFNVLDFNDDPNTAGLILFFIDLSGNALTDSRKEFFRSMLEGHFSELDRIETRQNELLEATKRLHAELGKRQGEFRVAVDDRILAVRKDGLAVFYAPDFAHGEVSFTPRGTHRELVPGFYLVAPEEALKEERRRITKQYNAGNVVLSLMVLLAAFLSAGLALTSQRRLKLDTMRTDFIATVSHELRTPLSLIRLHAETLHHGRIPESKVGDYHQTILTEAERLTGIVNNVLDFSRMERGKLELHPEPTDLSALCERIIESFQSRLEQNGFELEQNIQPGIIFPVDALAYSQILFNLIDNALKYSDSEKNIRVELESTDDWNILCVSDRGIGIPDKLKKKIFDDFIRSNDRKVTAQRGSGIGLSVAKQLVEKMGGTIDVQDNKPEGSVFTVKLRNGHETTGS